MGDYAKKIKITVVLHIANTNTGNHRGMVFLVQVYCLKQNNELVRIEMLELERGKAYNKS